MELICSPPSASPHPQLQPYLYHLHLKIPSLKFQCLMGAQVTKCMGPSGSKPKENIATVRSSTLTEDKIYVDCETRVFYTCLKDIDKKAYSLLEVKIRGIVAQAVATLGYFAVTNSYINTAIAEHIKIVLGALNDSENHERGMQITDIHFVAEAVDRSTRDLNHMRAVNVDATDSDNLTQAKSALRALRIQNGMTSMSSGERADILELFELLLSSSSQPRQVESLTTRFLDGESRRHQVALGGRGQLVAGGDISLVGGVDGRVSGLVDGGGSGRLAGGGCGLIAAGGSGLVIGGESGLVGEGRSGLVIGESRLVDGEGSGLVAGEESGLVDSEGSGLVAAGGSGLVDGGGSGLVVGGESGLVDGEGSRLVAAGGSGLVAGGESGFVDGGGSGLVAAGGRGMDPWAAHLIVYERLVALNSVLRNINGDPSVAQEVIPQPSFTIFGTCQLLIENQERLAALYSALRTDFEAQKPIPQLCHRMLENAEPGQTLVLRPVVIRSAPDVYKILGYVFIPVDSDLMRELCPSRSIYDVELLLLVDHGLVSSSCPFVRDDHFLPVNSDEDSVDLT